MDINAIKVQPVHTPGFKFPSPHPTPRPGRKHFWEKYTAEQQERFFRTFLQILEDRSPAAHSRRRNSTVQVGIDMPSIKSQLLEKLDFMRESDAFVSDSSIAHNMVAPNKGTTVGSLYSGAIDARTTVSHNDLHEDNPLVRPLLLFLTLSFVN